MHFFREIFLQNLQQKLSIFQQFLQSENEKKTERNKRTDLFQLQGARSKFFHISLKCGNLGITPVKITEILKNSEKSRRNFDENCKICRLL